MALIKFLRGSSQSISLDKIPYNDGYIYFTTDNGKFYIDADGRRIAVDEEAQNKINILEEKVTDLENSNKPMDSYDDGQGNVTIVAPFAEVSYDDGNVSIS